MPNSTWNKDYLYSALHVVVTRHLLILQVETFSSFTCTFSYIYVDIIYTVLSDFLQKYHTSNSCIQKAVVFLFRISLTKVSSVYYIFSIFKVYYCKHIVFYKYKTVLAFVFCAITEAFISTYFFVKVNQIGCTNKPSNRNFCICVHL